MTRFKLTLAFLACSVLGVACSRQQSLSTVSIPPDFTFATTRSVAVSVEADASLLDDSGVAGVEVRRPDGAVLYRGPLRAASSLRLKVAVPGRDRELELVLRSNRTEKIARLPIAGGAVAHTFR